MGEKDLSEKRLEDYADVFADIVNVLAFQGERLLREDNLIPGSTESLYKDETGALRSQLRDVLKYDMSGNTVISVIGLENQTDMDYDMVFRIMKYNAASYQSQIDRGEEHRRPVFTLVLYFGSKPWSGPMTVMEALKLDDIPYGKYAGDLVMDGRMNVYEIAFLPKETREKFTSDFRIAADYFCAVREGREQEFCQDKRAFKHVKELLDFFRIFSGDSRYGTYAEEMTRKSRKGEMVSMCTLLDSVLMEGEKKGEIKGKMEGEKELLSKQIHNLRTQGFTDSQIEQVLSLPDNKEWVRTIMEKL